MYTDEDIIMDMIMHFKVSTPEAIEYKIRNNKIIFK